MNLFLDERPDPDPDVDPPPAPYGLDYTDEENLAFWWSMGSQPLWMMVPLTLEVGERENLWQAQFAPFKLLRDLVWVEGDLDATVRAARPWLVLFWRVIDQSLLHQVNTYTYRTADYMLSTAQDYRKGLRGSQTHIAQATLGDHAIVFTQHPAYLPVGAGDPIPPDWDWQQQDEPGPGYWTGNGSEPRSAQHENVVIQIYAPQYASLAALGFGYRQETHAYVPHAHFDEVVQERELDLRAQGRRLRGPLLVAPDRVARRPARRLRERGSPLRSRRSRQRAERLDHRMRQRLRVGLVRRLPLGVLRGNGDGHAPGRRRRKRDARRVRRGVRVSEPGA